MAPRAVPPFLKKLMQVTESCPPSIGSWNEDGTQFVVTSSQFADILRQHFAGSLQTFVRQLHFYSFQKKDDGTRGIWTFSHPSFLRGNYDLLANIQRKPNPKKRSKDDDGEGEILSKSAGASEQSLEARLSDLEARVSRENKTLNSQVRELQVEVAQLKEELAKFNAAQSILSLAPEKLRVAKEEPKQETLESQGLSRPSKITRLISGRSVESINFDFPFEDSSSIGSVSMKDIMRELQTDVFADFDEFLPPVSYGGDVPSTPLNDQTVESANPCESHKEFNIPHNFELQPGVTITLLKNVFTVIAKMCCPKTNNGVNADNLRKLCDTLPHPSTLPPVEICPISLELLPVLRDNVTEKASDLQLIKAARQVYEVYHHNMMKKLQEKKEAGLAGNVEAKKEAIEKTIAL